MAEETTFIRIISSDRSFIIGYVAVKKDSKAEVQVVDHLLDNGFHLEQGNETEYNECKGEKVFRGKNIICVSTENIFLSK